MKKLAILSSHNGSGFEAIYKAIAAKKIAAQIPLLISNNPNAMALQKAKEFGIKTYIVNQKTDANPDEKIDVLLSEHGCEYVFLSGYMKKLSPLLTQKYKIINSHPSLLPKFGGAGMYGSFVHQAVVTAKESKSGVTIHEVNENYDEGKIVLQKELLLEKNETPQSLEERIKKLEKEAIIEALSQCLK